MCALVVLLLFCPYRSRNPLRGDSEGRLFRLLSEWRAADQEPYYDESRRVRDHAQDYYVAKKAARKGTKKKQKELNDLFGSFVGVDGGPTTACDDGSIEDAVDDAAVLGIARDTGPCHAHDVGECISDAWVARRRSLESICQAGRRASDVCRYIVSLETLDACPSSSAGTPEPNLVTWQLPLTGAVVAHPLLMLTKKSFLKLEAPMGILQVPLVSAAGALLLWTFWKQRWTSARNELRSIKMVSQTLIKLFMRGDFSLSKLSQYLRICMRSCTSLFV